MQVNFHRAIYLFDRIAVKYGKKSNSAAFRLKTAGNFMRDHAPKRPPKKIIRTLWLSFSEYADKIVGDRLDAVEWPFVAEASGLQPADCSRRLQFAYQAKVAPTDSTARREEPQRWLFSFGPQL